MCAAIHRCALRSAPVFGYERDRQAEERRERALDGLMTLIAEAVVKKMIEEEGGGAVRD
jgi:hypothetical protein